MKQEPGTVRERVQAAIALRLHANPAAPVSVAGICRDAAVSRANLYAHYPDLVAAIRATWQPRRVPVKQGPRDQDTSRTLPPVDKALLYLCLELRAELEALRKRAVVKSPAGRRKTAKS
jgi:AcrR family transcriptional regulator